MTIHPPFLARHVQEESIVTSDKADAYGRHFQEGLETVTLADTVLKALVKMCFDVETLRRSATSRQSLTETCLALGGGLRRACNRRKTYRSVRVAVRPTQNLNNNKS